MYSPWRRISPGRTFVSDTLRPHERLIADSCLANSSEGAKTIGQHGEGSYFVLATAPGMGNAQGRARGGAAAPDPQTQGAPLLHGPGRRVLPGPAGPRLRGGGPDGQAGGRRRRIQGGRREAPPFARGRPLQRRGRRLLDIRVPEHEDGPGMPAGLEGRLDGGDAPLPHSDMGRQHRMRPPAGSRSSGRGSPGPRPAKETASTTRRPRTSSRWPRPSFATIGGTAPMSSRGIWRSISTGIATCASRDAWTEAARSSAGSAGPLDSLLLPFRKRGPLQFWDAAQFDRAFRFVARFAAR